MLNIIATLHLLGVIVWVGGMFFAHMALRPVATEQLEPPQRLPFLYAVLTRFFRWVWLAVLTILITGYWIYLGAMRPRITWTSPTRPKPWNSTITACRAPRKEF